MLASEVMFVTSASIINTLYCQPEGNSHSLNVSSWLGRGTPQQKPLHKPGYIFDSADNFLDTKTVGTIIAHYVGVKPDLTR